MIEPQILSELKNFTSTEAYHKISLGCLLATDGIKFLAEKLECYWLFDICSSVQHLEKIRENACFIVWKIRVNPDKSFIVGAYSDYSKDKTEAENKIYLLYEQKAPYTDFKLNEFEFYQNDNILLLKSEY